jgi:ABC-2 type transport system permease protein
MSFRPDALPYEPFEQPPPAPARMAETRPLYWSIRRELWENRSVYLGPLIVAAIVLLSSAVNILTSAYRLRDAEPGKAARVIFLAYSMVPAPIMLASFLVGFFYCLDALHGERRDRSILFWKSMPVSDRVTVLSKAAIPLLVLPLIAYVLSVIAQLLLVPLAAAALLGNGMSAIPLWREMRFLQGLVIMAYGLAVHALWFAPIYGWLLLVSAWARRVPIVWAVLPPLALGIADRILFGSTHFKNLMGYRVMGAMTEAFTATTVRGHVNHLSQLDPGGFLGTPGLWNGLAFAAAGLALAVRLRRKREPI